MSKEMPLVVYVGEEKRGHRLQQLSQPLGWTVLTATGELQALGMYVFYMPDLIIVDSQNNATGAEKVVFHLQSVNAEPCMLLSTPAMQNRIPLDGSLHILPSAVEDSRVVHEASRLLQSELVIC